MLHPLSLWHAHTPQVSHENIGPIYSSCRTFSAFCAPSSSSPADLIRRGSAAATTRGYARPAALPGPASALRAPARRLLCRMLSTRYSRSMRRLPAASCAHACAPLQAWQTVMQDVVNHEQQVHAQPPCHLLRAHTRQPGSAKPQASCSLVATEDDACRGRDLPSAQALSDLCQFLTSGERSTPPGIRTPTSACLNDRHRGLLQQETLPAARSLCTPPGPELKEA